MPFTPSRAPAVVDKGKKSTYTTASEITSVRSVNAISSFVSTNNVVGSVKKAMQAAKGGNYVLSSTMSSAANGSRVKTAFLNNLQSSGGFDAFITQYSVGGSVNWTTKIAGNGNEYGNAICTDSSGNITVTGNYNSTSLICYSKGGIAFGTTLTNSGSNDVFIVQYSSTGLVNWAARIAGTGDDYGQAICTDSTGNITVTGNYTSNPLYVYDKNGIAFGTTLTNSSGNDVFIVQYSSAGSVNWVARIAGSGNDYGVGICTDSTGNITVTGYYNSNPLRIYDKDGNQFTTTLPNSGNNDIFIVQYSSTGSVNWVARIGGGDNDRTYAICASPNGNINVTGWFASGDLTCYNKNGVPFGTVLAGDGGHMVLIAQYSSAGLVNWVTRMQGQAFQNGYGICVDLNGNVNVTGDYIAGTSLQIYNVDGAQSNVKLTSSPAGQNGFIVQYSSTGYANWAIQFGITSYDSGRAMSTDSSGNINFTGYCGSRPLIFYDRNGNMFPKTLGGIGGSYAAQYNSNGFVNWINKIGGTGNDAQGNGICTSSSGDVIVAGAFSSTLINPETVTYPSI
jgi:hypothetical protein